MVRSLDKIVLGFKGFVFCVLSVICGLERIGGQCALFQGAMGRSALTMTPPRSPGAVEPKRSAIRVAAAALQAAPTTPEQMTLPHWLQPILKSRAIVQQGVI